jgi:hypothetical protein
VLFDALRRRRRPRGRRYGGAVGLSPPQDNEPSVGLLSPDRPHVNPTLW